MALWVTLTACGSTSPARHAPPVGQAVTSTDRLYVAGSVGPKTGIQVFDPATHALVRQLPLGVPSPDWRALYSVATTPKPQLVATDPATGVVLRTLDLPDASYELPPATLGGLPGGLSQNGAYLVLSAPNYGQPTSRLLVVDASFNRAPVKVELAGNFVFDAISNDGIRLYLIQYVTSADYHVRLYNVLSRYLETYVIADKREPGTMQGLRISGVFSHDGTWLYSIYARKDRGPFIHALNLDGHYAWCIDFAESTSSSFGPDDLSWSLALTPDGSLLYAANGATGEVVVINVQKQPQAVSRIAQLTHVPVASAFVVDAHAKEIGGNDAVVSADGETLVFAGVLGVTWVDLSTLKARTRQLTDQTVVSLALNPSGSTLYALGESGSIGVVPMTAGMPGAWSWFVTTVQPVALVRVEAL